ncbi:hypothetical protein JW707_00590 [Candidatus Woesearchaeota archaeon]|nr:hypothetical protein [Candidatus Woesearchaeota archaeon]
MVDAGDLGRRKNLDKEISSYISGIRRKERTPIKSILHKLKRKKKKSVELHPEVSTYGNEGKAEEKKSKEETEKEEEEIEQEFEEGASQKTFMEWLKGMFTFEKKPDESLEEAGERMEEEEKAEEASEESPEDEIEDEYLEEVKKESWIGSLFSRIFMKSREEEELEDVQDEIAEDFQDLKVVAEIATKVMKQLPPEKMKSLKESEDFKMFKEILKRRELIK